MNEQVATPYHENLMADVHSVLNGTEQLLAAAGDTSDASPEFRRTLAANLKLAKARLREAEEAVVTKTRVAARATDQYVHEHPWKAIGAAAGVAFLLGLLVSRR